MKKIQHTAFYITHNGDKDWLMDQIKEGSQLELPVSLSKLRGEIFSNNRIKHFINEEIRHDHFEIVAGNNNTLSCSSNGEQRKALLSFIIDRKPDYIIVDDVFESLDKDARQSVLLMLKVMAENTMFIQVFSRENELLPFIKTIYIVESRSVISSHDPKDFPAQLNFKNNYSFNGIIPPPFASYEPQTRPLVAMNNLSVQYNGRPVLKNICWEINGGEFWQLTGPNGSGKSTLLSLITGNSAKGYGQDIFLFGHRKGTGESIWEFKKKIGYFAPSMAFQFERQDSVEQMIISGFFDSIGLYTKPNDRQVQLARDWLSVIGMDKDSNQPFRLLPTGRQRMVLIARAMVKHPPLLILDEPTSGLDDEMAALFTVLINKIAAKTSTAIVYVSHREEAGLTTDRIFELLLTGNGSVGKVRK
ncbi:MAG: ATP-binding cassette domain-containing protein [Ferruginibacter sp.]|nr:ATP-binding cassette domain-containing protein [Ferruginibacter sp.]